MLPTPSLLDPNVTTWLSDADGNARARPNHKPASHKPDCAGAAVLIQDRPSGRMVAGAFPASHLPVHARVAQARRDGGAEQDVIETQPGIARPAIPLIVPEGVD